MAGQFGLVEPLTSEKQFHADPLVRLAAELMDPLHGVPLPAPRWSAAELRAVAKGANDRLMGVCPLCREACCLAWRVAFERLLGADELSDCKPLHQAPGVYVRSHP